MYDIIIPVMFVSENDQTTFDTNPVEYIRNLFDFTETMFQPKHQIKDLLSYICCTKNADGNYEYLNKFLEYVVK